MPSVSSNLLTEVFSPFNIPTTGIRPETGRQLIDDIAISKHFSHPKVLTWDKEFDGVQVSDHDGVLIEI